MNSIIISIDQEDIRCLPDLSFISSWLIHMFSVQMELGFELHSLQSSLNKRGEKLAAVSEDIATKHDQQQKF